MKETQAVTGRIKVVWLCHFSTQEVRKHLNPKGSVSDFAPWIPGLLKAFQGHDDEVELHVVAPHKYISGLRRWESEGVHYYFFNPFIPIWGRPWPGFFRLDLWTGFASSKRRIRKIVAEIKPDLIHLHGFENAYYAEVVLQLRHYYPVFTTIQGFASHIVAWQGRAIEYRKDVERRIIQNLRHFGYRTQTMKEDLLAINPEAIMHKHRYYVDYPVFPRDRILYDIVIFAANPVSKGLADIIKALAMLKQTEGLQYTLLVIGSVAPSARQELDGIAREANLEDKITYLGYMETQAEVLEKAATARICVLPTRNDVIPGTIVESMYLGIPVIAYDTGSIHELNKDGEYVILVPQDDIEGLACQIKRLLSNPELQKSMADKGRIHIKSWFDNDSIFPDLLQAYRETISDFCSGPK
ncbi:MAG TPA: glycosyltransferase family 4 protein [Candidatus Cloacimonadota bacterium]|nr:glycosyltransferase family 4 protein [Candidatus Cloacimonadota bacterium]